MHAVIEFAKKKNEIFVPQQWATVIRMARRKDPYMIGLVYSYYPGFLSYQP
jgi:hypothetical protein